MLKAAWIDQASYNEELNRLRKRDMTPQQWLQTFAFGILSETDELMRLQEWRPHRRSKAFNTREDLADELADITKYTICMWQVLGFTADEALRAVLQKGEALRFRLQTEFDMMPQGRKILICDLDGTLADYVGGFRAFAEVRLNRKLPELVLPPTTNLDTVMGMSFPDYDKLKEEFELLGGYRRLPAYPKMVEIVKRAWDNSWMIIVVSNRPVHIGRCWYDTWYWLRDQGIVPDRLVFGYDIRVSMANVLAKLGNRVIMLDDDPLMIRRGAAVAPVIMINQSYNGDLHPGEGWGPDPMWLRWDRDKPDYDQLIKLAERKYGE